MNINPFNKLASIFNTSERPAIGKQPDKISDIFRKTWKIEDRGWQMRPITDRTVEKEAGITEQIKVELTLNGKKVLGRAKQIANLNEACVYHKMNKKGDPLKEFVPEFLGVLDRDGNQLDLNDLLQQHSVSDLCRMGEFRPVYLVMKDLLHHLGDDVEVMEGVQDFKFARPSLHNLEMEKYLHGQTKRGFLYRAVKGIFFKSSGCSFAFSGGLSKDKWYAFVVHNFKRLMQVKKTKNELGKQLERLPDEQLEALQERLRDLRIAVENSSYALADSSLLFIPVERTVNGKKVNDLEIRLIDLSHGFSVDEVGNDDDKKDKHTEMRVDMRDSLWELDLMVDQIMERRGEVSP